MKKPIFIVGVGRSGTSLLHSMLAAHPAMAVPPETHFVRGYVAKRKLEKLLRTHGLAGVEKTLAEDERVSRLGVDVGECLRSFETQDPRIADAAVYGALLEAFREQSGKDRVGDKDPKNVEYLPLVHRHWPDAFIIHIMRDPRDVLASKKKAAWSRKRHALLHILANRTQFRAGRRLGRALFGRQYCEVWYEDLIADAEGELRRICQQVELEFVPEMLEFSKAAKGLVSTWEMSWKKETLGPVLKKNTGKWQRSLSPFEVSLTEAACAEAMSSGRFSRSGGDGLSNAGRVAVAAGNGALILADPLYQLVHRWRRLGM